jgi:hypothetical protein
MNDYRREDSLDFLAKGLVASHHLTLRTRVAWQHEFRAEVDRRGGLVDGSYFDKTIANALLRELTQRSMRYFHNELVKRLAETLTEEEAERLDAEASDTLAAALAQIKD